MLYNSKAAVTSLGITGPIVAIALIVAKTQGVDLTPELEGLPNLIAALLDQADLIIAILVGAYGRLRASTKISGLFTSK